jgi:hypothetical protein
MIATIQSAHGVKDGLVRIFTKAIDKPSLLEQLQDGKETAAKAEQERK